MFRLLCILRGQHLARRPKRIIPQMLHGCATPISAAVEFRCICGAKQWRTVDYTRGGRIPVPFAWPLTEPQSSDWNDKSGSMKGVE